MAWIALCDGQSDQFDPAGLGARPGTADLIESGADALMVRGALVMEMRMPPLRRPRPLVQCTSADGRFHLAVQALPGGGLSVILQQSDHLVHRLLHHPEDARVDILRLTCTWDAPRRRGWIALERPDSHRVVLLDMPAPRPVRIADLMALVAPGPDRFLAPDLRFLALSDSIEPVGPVPALTPGTPVATPQGYRALGNLRRGDLVVTPDGRTVPVLQVVARQVPARGSFAPLRLRAPYFGLRRDVDLAATQHLVFSGTEVEYMFGHPSVLLPVGHLAGTPVLRQAQSGALVTYCNVLLPDHDALDVAGMPAESLFIARLRRNREVLGASLLAGFERATLPEHGRSAHPVLGAFEARVLTDHGSALISAPRRLSR